MSMCLHDDNEVIRWIIEPFDRVTLAPCIVQRCERDGRQGIAVLSAPEEEGAEPRFRHVLAWFWDWSKPILFVIMLNPSTANAFEDDQTMKKVFGFAQRNGYGGVIVQNLYDYRATKPAAARAAGWPVTGYGRQMIDRALNDLRASEVRRDVLCAWGNNGPALAGWATGRRRDDRVKLFHLGLVKKGAPEHPCMIGYDRVLTEWEG